MKITFLGSGTSQGVPVITCKCEVCQSDDIKDKRLRSSILVEHKKHIFTIDAGPDFRQQMLRENVNKLDAIFITHGHKDHVGGMDDVRAFNFKQKKAMDVYADELASQSIKTEFAYAFVDDKYPGVPDFNLHLIENEIIDFKDLKIIPIPLLHRKLPVLGFRIDDFTYITDANSIPEPSMKLIEGTKTLIINALRKEKHISHFTLSEALKIIEIIEPEKAYLTHLSHLMGKHSQISTELPKNVFLAYDGLSFEL